jgi:hypothetical protein
LIGKAQLGCCFVRVSLFERKISKVTIDVQPSHLSAADKKAVQDVEEAAAAIED